MSTSEPPELSLPEPAPVKRELPKRERLPDERFGMTKTFRLLYAHKDGTPDVMKFYFRTGCYADGRLGEVFITTDKVGTLASGMIDAVATLVSLLLQYGVPLEVVTSKLRGTRFTPNGFPRDQAGEIDKDVRNCSSPLDLLAQYLHLKYGEKES